MRRPILQLLHGARVLDKLMFAQLVMKFTSYYGNLSFITVYTRVGHFCYSEPYALSYPKFSFPFFKSSDQNFVLISDLCHECYMSRPFHST